MTPVGNRWSFVSRLYSGMTTCLGVTVEGDSAWLEIAAGLRPVGLFGEREGGFGIRLRDAHRIQDAAGMLAAAHDHAPRAGDLEDFVFAFAENLDEALDFARDPGDLDHERLRG